MIYTNLWDLISNKLVRSNYFSYICIAIDSVATGV